MAFVGILSQIKLLFGPLVIQLVWYQETHSLLVVYIKYILNIYYYILKQLILLDKFFPYCLKS